MKMPYTGRNLSQFVCDCLRYNKYCCDDKRQKSPNCFEIGISCEMKFWFSATLAALLATLLAAVLAALLAAILADVSRYICRSVGR